MAVRYRDYYEVLGVARDSTDQQIRQAFRKLARKYHPDVNPDDRTAEEKFKEINEAYEVLSDPSKRKRYDQLGANWKDGAEFTPPPGWGQVNVDFGDLGSVFGGGGFSDFFESLFGGAKSGSRQRRSARARSPRGRDAETEMTISLEDAHRGGVHRIAIQGIRECAECGGSGVSGNVICPTCRGAGQLVNPRTIDVNIPPGARDGSVIKIARQGEQGGAERGDLFIKLRVKPHSRFSVSGDDINSEVPITPSEAVLGSTIEVQTIEGKAEVKVPPGSQGGQRMRLRGQGLNRRTGGRGDHYVKLKVVVPIDPSDEEKRLYGELSRASSFNPRKT